MLRNVGHVKTAITSQQPVTVQPPCVPTGLLCLLIKCKMRSFLHQICFPRLYFHLNLKEIKLHTPLWSMVKSESFLSTVCFLTFSQFMQGQSLTTTLFAFSTQILIHYLLCGGDFPSVSIQTPLFNLWRQCPSVECIYGVTLMINYNNFVQHFWKQSDKVQSKTAK